MNEGRQTARRRLSHSRSKSCPTFDRVLNPRWPFVAYMSNTQFIQGKMEVSVLQFSWVAQRHEQVDASQNCYVPSLVSCSDQSRVSPPPGSLVSLAMRWRHAPGISYGQLSSTCCVLCQCPGSLSAAAALLRVCPPLPSSGPGQYWCVLSITIRVARFFWRKETNFFLLLKCIPISKNSSDFASFCLADGFKTNLSH